MTAETEFRIETSLVIDGRVPPHPNPLPWGEGALLADSRKKLRPLEIRKRQRFSLSPRERVGVRGKAPTEFALRIIIIGLLAVLAAGCGNDESTSLANSRFFRAVEIVGRRGAGVGEFNKPRSLAVDRNDNLYVVDMTGRVQKFSPEGRYLLSWQMPQTDLGKPKGM